MYNRGFQLLLGLRLLFSSSWKIIWCLQLYLSKKFCRFILTGVRNTATRKLSKNLKIEIPYTDTYLTKFLYIQFSAIRFRFLDKLTLVGQPTTNRQSRLKTANWTISTLVILTNIYFLLASFLIIKSSGGAFGYGLLVLPISLLTNLLLISAGLTFKAKFNNSVVLLVINSLGLMWALFWFWLFLSN